MSIVTNSLKLGSIFKNKVQSKDDTIKVVILCIILVHGQCNMY